MAKEKKLKDTYPLPNVKRKPGRPLKYTPEQLWQKFTEYVNDTEGRTWYRNEAIKSGERAGDIIQVPTLAPLTQLGFCLYAEIDNCQLDEYAKKEEFSVIVTRIRDAIKRNKFDGASVGAFNPAIIARDLGLMERVQMQGEGSAQLNINVNGKGINLKKE